VTGEMALTIVLLAGAGVMIRSYLKIHTAEIGVNTANILGAAIYLPPAKYAHAEDKISFYERLTTRLGAMPGVESVATADGLPSCCSDRLPYELAGAPPADELRRAKLAEMKISPGYFRTLGARLLSGREFNDADAASAVPVAIVNQLLAAEFWLGEDPLGKRLRFFDRNAPGPWLTVVGVVSNIIQNDINRQRFDPVVYLPYRQDPGGGAWVLVRTRVRPESLVNAFRREVQALDSDLPLYGPTPIAERMERFWDSRFYGSMFLIFAAIALLLASIGLYAVIAHSVSQRTQELGIRMAIGATARDIVGLVFRQGMIPMGAGLIIGLAASLAVNRVLKSMLIQVSPADTTTLMVASAVLIFSAMLGCLIPARRAMRVDPAVSLRHE
jgi:putative ABC transport system permease protein